MMRWLEASVPRPAHQCRVCSERYVRRTALDVHIERYHRIAKAKL